MYMPWREFRGASGERGEIEPQEHKRGGIEATRIHKSTKYSAKYFRHKERNEETETPATASPLGETTAISSRIKTLTDRYKRKYKAEMDHLGHTPPLGRLLDQ